jgi:hypothetical protein
MDKIEELIKDIEFKGITEYDIKTAPVINDAVNQLKKIGAPDEVIQMFQYLLRESYICGVKTGILFTIEKSLEK